MGESEFRREVRAQISLFQADNSTNENPSLKTLLLNLQAILDDDKDEVCSHHHSKLSSLKDSNLAKKLKCKYESKADFSSESPEAEACRNPLIIQNIVQHLDSADMKTCRLVDGTWNETIIRQMLQDDLFTIHFTYDRDLHHYLQNRMFLKDLVQCLTPSSSSSLATTAAAGTKFPCSNFSFTGGNLDDADDFFSLYGSKIRTLSLQPSSNEDDDEVSTDELTLKKILTCQAPNVESLIIGYYPAIQWKDEMNKLVLPNLKNLTCICDSFQSSTAFAMLADTQKLESVHNFKIPFVNFFVVKNKMPTIKHCRVGLESDYDPLVGVEQLLTFARSRPQLTHLIFPHIQGWSRMSVELQNKYSTALNLIFQSSRDSVKILHIDSLTSIPHVTLPPMKNLKTLRLLDLSGFQLPSSQSIENHDHGILPRGTILPEIFPNLETLSLELVHMDVNLWTKYFPPGSLIGNFASVKTLVADRWSSFSFAQLRNFVPNVTQLILTQFRRMDLSSICLNYPHVQEIEVKFPPFVDMNLDSCLTGISEGDCKYLRESSGRVVADLEDLKNRPSICDLHNLRRLKLSVANKDIDEDEAMDFCAPSHISGIYAFSLMPDLQVTIAYHKFCPSSSKISSALRSVAPYVNFIHENVMIQSTTVS